MKPVSFSIASRRSISSLASTSLRGTVKPSPAIAIVPKKPQCLPRPLLRQSFRRAYADAPQATLSPTPKPKKRFRFFRFIWRVTYLSTCALIGYTGYQIWEGRNPAEQFEPDPSKKTLVILGTCFIL